MSNQDQEVWKTYPDYPFIEVSNLGRVRTKDRIVVRSDGRKRFVKGKVLKQQFTRDGYLYVQFWANGKHFSLRIHRMVAVCFIPNPDNLPEINHIDNDKTNNFASNLEWCTDQYNQNYKKNFGTSPAQIFGKPVFAVNLETGKVLRFESRHEAERQLGIANSNISAVVKGKLIQVGGYWFTEDESEITEEKIQEVKAKMTFRGSVIAINIGTSEVFLFETQSEAARQLGISISGINKVVEGLYNKTKGLWFCYADENAVEKVRSKFGDEVARKVEELINENNS